MERNDRGDVEKVFAMIGLGLGSFIAGMLSSIIPERNRHRFPLATSFLKCFGAGILMATALVHILPEVRKQMGSNYAEIAICGGFFIIYFIDEFIHYFFGEAIQHTHQQHHHQPGSNAASANNYGAIDESSPLLSQQQQQHIDNHDQDHEHHHHVDHIDTSNNRNVNCDDSVVADVNARICHTNHTEPCVQSMTGTLGLFVALSLHATIEGLAIGVQNSASKVLFLLGAVACHKFVMSFCLGVEFRSNPRANLRSQLIVITVFSLGAVLGIGLGMLIVDLPENWSATTLPIIQGLAGGTLFYVTVCEVIPREKARWHQNTTQRAAGLAQFLFVVVGFSTMCIINFYLSDDGT